MRLETLDLYRLTIPFRFAFEHAAARRRVTETIWVRARAKDGAVGFGEGCPRSYVTGESLASAAAFYRRHGSRLLEIGDVCGLAAFAEHREDVDENPAAWCAFELAVLDALGRSSGRSVESLVGCPETSGEFRYTAVLGVMDRARFRRAAATYREMGFVDFKLKLSGRLEEDRANLDCVRAEGAVERLRVDANNLWASPEEAGHYLESLGGGIFAIEEPLASRSVTELLPLSRGLGVPIVLDESFSRAPQLDRLPSSEAFILNVRVSKMGGLLRSLDAVRAARSRGIPMIVGAQVGETSVLARAALGVAREAGELLVGQEGAFGDHLLAEDVAEPSIRFGAGGVLMAEPSNAGLGLTVANPERFLEPLATSLGSSLTSAVPRN